MPTKLESIDPALEIFDIKQGNRQWSFYARIAEGYADKISRTVDFPIVICSGSDCEEYHYHYVNRSIFEFKPKVLLGKRSGKLVKIMGIVHGYQLKSKPLRCRLVGAGDDASYQIVRRLCSSEYMALNVLEVSGVDATTDAFAIEWIQDDKGHCENRSYC